jgi:hypothetical protein
LKVTSEAAPRTALAQRVSGVSDFAGAVAPLQSHLAGKTSNEAGYFNLREGLNHLFNYLTL